MTGERKAMRTSIISVFCVWFTSVVRRVTSEAVLNLSIFRKEKCCTFSNSAWRRLREKPIAPMDAARADPAPKPRDRKAISTISPPSFSSSAMSMAVSSALEIILIS